MTTRTLRVLQLMKTLRRGGAEVLAASLVGAHARELQVTVGIFDREGTELAGTVEEYGGAVHAFDAPTHLALLASVDRVARYLRTGRFDLVHCHLPLVGVVGRLAGALARVPVVYTEHNLFHRYHPATQAAARATWHLQAHVIAVSDEVAHELAPMRRPPPVTVVKNGVDTARFRRTPGDRDAARARLGFDESAFVVGAVTVFRPAKRLDRWVQVAARVAAALPHARFLLVGWGPLEAEVRDAVARAGLADRVVLPGPQADVRPFLAAMDCYLMSSEHEGLPVALLEAMAMELPVVTTAVGGVPEVVEHGASGFLVEAGDPVAALAARVLEVGGIAPLRCAALGAAGRARVDARHGLANMARAIERIYDDAAGGARG